MNSKEFLAEVLQSELCPPDFEKTYQEFQAYQQAAIDTLNEFHRVCEKNNIPYQLAYGSLLGNVRDGGQIPWDYDIDVFVPYEERNNLIQALKKDLDEKFYFYCPEINPKCRHVIMRITPKGYRTEALHVDVFYLIGLPDDETQHDEFISRVRELSNIRYAKLVNIREESRKRIKTVLRMVYNRLKYIGVSVSSCAAELEDICSRYKVIDAKQCISSFSEGNKKYDTSLFAKTMLVQTEIGEFRISGKYNEILQMMYQDYKQILPLESRLNELYQSYNTFKYYENL